MGLQVGGPIRGLEGHRLVGYSRSGGLQVGGATRGLDRHSWVGLQ